MEENKAFNNKVKSFILPLAAILVIVFVLQLMYSRREGCFVELKPQNGVLDISNLDFDSKIYTIANSWDFYPNKLYTSSDFKNKNLEPSKIIPGKTPYGTFRLLIKGSPNKYYTLCGYSVDYCSEVFVNGSKVVSFGKVTDNPETSIPKTGYQTIPIYTGETGEVELICRYNNFVHNDGGTIHATYISIPQNIENYKTGNSLVSIALGGGLLIMCLYFLLYAAVQKQKNYLLLSFCCVIFSFRDQLFTFLNLLPPTISWELGYRLYIGVINLLPVSIIILLWGLFPYGSKKVKAIYLTIVLGFLAAIIFADTKQLTLINGISYGAVIPFAIYLVVRIIKHFCKNKKIKVSEVVSLIGFGVLVPAAIIEGILSLNNASILRYGLTPTAMLIFVFIIAISISLSIQEQKIELIKSQSRSQMLEKMNTMNIDFLHKVGHELKTPLTVISGYAQLTRMQLDADTLNEETPEHLSVIQKEATRLGDMVTRLMDYSYGKQNSAEFGDVSINEILKNTEAICRPMCLKNNNKITVSGEDAVVYGNSEMLLQVMINLVVNSNKHTENGVISVETEKDGVNILFKVKDTGTGISEEDAPHIFEKNYSPDGSSGLGLYICAEALETHKGKIWLDETSEKGTTFAFTIPQKEKYYE